MIYQSTRNCHLTATAPQAVLQGLAPDGGLYVLPDLKALNFDWQAALKKDTLGMAAQILHALLPEYRDMDVLVHRAYEGKFETEDLTPLKKVGDDYILELFRGPTSAFKDVALSMLPQLMTAARIQEKTEDEIVILTATSGDTGKAALAGFCNVPGTRILVFYPEDGVSAIQKAQMVTQQGNNVCVCAVRGNFDDAQTGVKLAFSAAEKEHLLSGKGVRLSSANSINIGRLAPQVVYYFKAYADLVNAGRITEGETADYVVPTGNFGDILAGWYAKELGLPVGRLVCASNANDVLTEFLHTGVYNRIRPFHKTLSPSMDILVSSNLERLLFYLSGGNDKEIAQYMRLLSETGQYRIVPEMRRKLSEQFWAGCCDDLMTEQSIAQLWREHSYLSDTHTAVAWNVAQQYKKKSNRDRPLVILSTASAYKFPVAVLQALGGDAAGNEFDRMERLHELTGVPIPKNLSGLRDREILHEDVIDRDEILHYVLSRVSNADKKEGNPE
jgi:threonine synthase